MHSKPNVTLTGNDVVTKTQTDDEPPVNTEIGVSSVYVSIQWSQQQNAKFIISHYKIYPPNVNSG